MLGRLERHRDARLGRELASPQPGGEHDLLALDVAALGADADAPGRASSTKSVTSVSSKMRTPRCRAPLAIDIVTSTGLARPSSGVQKPWMMSSVRISGTMSATSLGDSTSLVIPTERMYAVSRR